MQSNLYVHTKYENMEETYLYPIWEFYNFNRSCNTTNLLLLVISGKNHPSKF
jgi:hypothetical protein